MRISRAQSIPSLTRGSYVCQQDQLLRCLQSSTAERERPSGEDKIHEGQTALFTPRVPPWCWGLSIKLPLLHFSFLSLSRLFSSLPPLFLPLHLLVLLCSLYYFFPSPCFSSSRFSSPSFPPSPSSSFPSSSPPNFAVMKTLNPHQLFPSLPPSLLPFSLPSFLFFLRSCFPSLIFSFFLFPGRLLFLPFFFFLSWLYPLFFSLPSVFSSFSSCLHSCCPSSIPSAFLPSCSPALFSSPLFLSIFLPHHNILPPILSPFLPFSVSLFLLFLFPSQLHLARWAQITPFPSPLKPASSEWTQR